MATQTNPLDSIGIEAIGNGPNVDGLVTCNRGTQRVRIRAFLTAICSRPNIPYAAGIAGIGSRTHYDWLRDVPGYPEAFARAQKIGWDAFEGHCEKRASVGYEEPVYQQGALVGTKTVYSDRLAEVLLKGNIGKYKDQQVTAGGISIHLAVGINAGQQAPPAAVVQAIEVQALPAAVDPDDEFGIALLASSTTPTT